MSNVVVDRLTLRTVGAVSIDIVTSSLPASLNLNLLLNVHNARDLRSGIIFPSSRARFSFWYRVLYTT